MTDSENNKKSQKFPAKKNYEKSEEIYEPKEVEKLNDEEAIAQQRKLEKIIREASKELKLLGNKTKRGEEKLKAFKEPRNVFIFRFTKVDKKNGEESQPDFVFDTQRFLYYTKGLVKKIFQKQKSLPTDEDIKITSMKSFSEYFYFKTDKMVKIPWLATVAKGDNEKCPFKITQYRTGEMFFEDFDEML